MHETPAPYPLIIDLDDTLIFGDCFRLQLAKLLQKAPWKIFEALALFIKGGRPPVKKWLAELYPISPAELHYRDDLLDYLHTQKEAGQKIYLVSAAAQENVTRVADYLNIFDGAFGSSNTHNLKSKNKLRFIQEKIARDFIYAGDAFADIPIWKESKGAILCGKAPIFQGRLGIPDALCFPNPRF